MKRAIIFYNGDLASFANVKQHIKKTDFIICADGGAEHALQCGITPHVVIGDFDSLKKTSQKKLGKQSPTWIRFPKEKDETDSELALQYALENAFTTIIIFGAFGSRLDHMLTNIFALTFLEEKGVDVTIVEGKQELRVTRKKITLKGKHGDLVSLIPLKGDVKNAVTTNLVYKLAHEDLFFGYSRGISNVMTKKTATVSITDGVLLVIHTRT